MINIGGRIAQLRLEESLSAVGLSQQLGFPRHAIEHFESGRQTPNKQQQEKLATFFGVSTAYLRGETNDPTRQDSWMDMAYDSGAPDQNISKETPVPMVPPKKTKTEDAGESDGAWLIALLRSQAAQDIIREIVRDELGKGS